MYPSDEQLRVYRNVQPSKAEVWMATHPKIYEEFSRLAWEGIMAGHKKLGAKQLGEVIRWNGMLRRDPKDTYLLNNTYITAMAHRFVQENPQCESVFEFRDKK